MSAFLDLAQHRDFFSKLASLMVSFFMGDTSAVFHSNMRKYNTDIDEVRRFNRESTGPVHQKNDTGKVH
jgi:hypothetical protein